MKEEKDHWENIYRVKKPEELSWTEEIPHTSLEFIHSFQLPKTARIIDVGGGDSRLVDFLLDENFEDITILDISSQAIEKSKKRLGDKANKVKWLEQDITKYEPDKMFDVWHDRAAFHFLTTDKQISKYLSIARQSISHDGYAILGTFSENGPEKCSGLPIRKYSEHALVAELSSGFEKLKCITDDHITPFRTRQNFLFCSFKRA